MLAWICWFVSIHTIHSAHGCIKKYAYRFGDRATFSPIKVAQLHMMSKKLAAVNKAVLVEWHIYCTLINQIKEGKHFCKAVGGDNSLWVVTVSDRIDSLFVNIYYLMFKGGYFQSKLWSHEHFVKSRLTHYNMETCIVLPLPCSEDTNTLTKQHFWSDCTMKMLHKFL